MPDEEYIKRLFKLYEGRDLDLKNPRTFNEKIQWLKLYDRNPLYSILADKYLVKEYVASIIGEEYIIPTYGVWTKFDDIDFDKFPDQFVLKCTHDSGGIVICKNRLNFNIKKAKRKIMKHLGQNWYYKAREWAYKDIQPRIIAEQYMTDESGVELKDYKIFNFNGKAKLIQVDYDRFTKHKRNLYTTDWQYINASIQFPTDPYRIIPRPQNLEKMIELAEILSRGFAHVRTDFYSINGQIYFGEMTFYHGAGFEKFTPYELEVQMGNWLKLPL